MKRFYFVLLLIISEVIVHAHVLQMPLARGGEDRGGTIYTIDLRSGYENVYSMTGTHPTHERNQSQLGTTGGITYEASNNSLYISLSAGPRFSAGQINEGQIMPYDLNSQKTHLIYQFNFESKVSIGGVPIGPLVKVNGKLDGVMNGGGSEERGLIFSVDPSNDMYTIEYEFSISDGGKPTCGLFLYKGLLYGGGVGTATGIDNGREVFFSFDPVTSTYNTIFSSETGGVFGGPTNMYIRNDIIYFSAQRGISSSSLNNPLNSITHWIGDVGVGGLGD